MAALSRGCKPRIIGPGLTFAFVQKAFFFFAGLIFGGAYFGGAYYWREVFVSKWVGIGI